MKFKGGRDGTVVVTFDDVEVELMREIPVQLRALYESPDPDPARERLFPRAYLDPTEEAAEECRAAYANVFAVWQKALARKDPSSLLANNINHPNDFGHWLYLQALAALEL